MGWNKTNSLPETTLAERRGKVIGPLVDSMLLDHPIYGYTRSPHVNFVNGRGPQPTMDPEDGHELDQYEMDAKTPKPNHITEMSPVESTSPDANTGSSMVGSEDEHDLSRRGLPSACVFIAK